MIQIKRGSTKSWHDTEVKLASGQPGYDKDTHQLKIGDGETLWSDLPSVGGADYIIDFGSSDGWTYQKWASGIARCWCIKQIGLLNLSGTSGLFKQDNAVTTSSYPITFTAVPCEIVTVQSDKAILWAASKIGNTESASGTYAILSTDISPGISCAVSIQVEGFWK